MTPTLLTPWHETTDPPIAEKQCKDCGQTKPLEGFNRNHTLRLGVESICRICRKARRRKRREASPGAEREKRHAWAASEFGRQRLREHARLTAARHPQKIVARNALKHAITGGKVAVQLWCDICGRASRPMRDGRRSIQAHHHNGYDNPLDVIWLCVDCHAQAHHCEEVERAG